MRKRILSLFVVMVMALSLMQIEVFANNPFSTGQCTWYAYKRWTELLGYEPAVISGNAGGWYDNAQKKGYSVGSVPKVGAIVCWNNGFGDDTGHVAIVESVNSDSIYISEYNWNVSKGFNNATVYFSNINRSSTSKPNRHLKGYIYLPGSKQDDSAAVDIGTNFYANIIQRDDWATVVNNNGSVEIAKENGYANELWWFERLDDGSYHIQSMEDNRYLDVDNAKTDNGTIIKVWEYSGTDAQKWYVKTVNMDLLYIRKMH